MTPLAMLFLRRGARLWVGARVLVLAVLLFGALPEGPPYAAPYALTPGAAAAMVGIAVALGLVDVARRGERALLGNLGVSRAQLLAWLALPAALGELAMATLLPGTR